MPIIKHDSIKVPIRYLTKLIKLRNKTISQSVLRLKFEWWTFQTLFTIRNRTNLILNLIYDSQISYFSVSFYRQLQISFFRSETLHSKTNRCQTLTAISFGIQCCMVRYDSHHVTNIGAIKTIQVHCPHATFLGEILIFSPWNCMF